ncbi:hypothetical protein CPC16_002621 [Podila verticillata]|nr:hypothetical protein CPC16_002621 [Podila verticillata]
MLARPVEDNVEQLQKRAGRGHPSTVIPLQTTESGELNYPVTVGKGINEVIIEDMGMPEISSKHTSSSGARELTLKCLSEQGFNAKTHALGPDMYGLTNLGVIKYIQGMPNTYRSRRRPRYFRTIGPKSEQDQHDIDG